MDKATMYDVVKSYNWLGHNSFTELNAFHPEYKKGKENRRETFPKIEYVSSVKGVIDFVDKHQGTHTICYGINPRPEIFKKESGKERAALEKEIEIAQNLYFDLDFIPKNVSKAQWADFYEFLSGADDYFLDLGLNKPVRSYTGRGFHQMFAFPEIKVKEHPDIADRIKKFAKDFGYDHKEDLADLEVRLDSTQDLRRMKKIDGTAKANVGIISKFYGKGRSEDPALKDYLLSMSVSENLGLNYGKNNKNPSNVSGIDIYEIKLPKSFKELLTKDERLRNFWLGNGKPENSDISGSGYDFSLIKRALELGYGNENELAIVLALRPNGSVKNSGKDEKYIQRTIENARIVVADKANP